MRKKNKILYLIIATISISILLFALLNDQKKSVGRFTELSKINLVHVSQEFKDSICLINHSQYLIEPTDDAEKIIITGVEIKDIRKNKDVYQIQTKLQEKNGSGIGVSCGVYLLSNVGDKIEVRGYDDKLFSNYNSQNVNEYKESIIKQYNEIYKNKQ